MTRQAAPLLWLVAVFGCGSADGVDKDGPTSSLQARTDSGDGAAPPVCAWKTAGELNGRPPIPELDAIESISAESYGHPFLLGDTGSFVVPRARSERLLAWFRGATIDTAAWCEDDELGTMRIKLVGGRAIRICWFWAGHGAHLSFSCGGIRYRRTGPKESKDETLAFDAAVRLIHEEVKNGP